MKMLLLILSAFVVSSGVYSAPLSSDDGLIDTATIKNISDAYLYAIYVSQHASTIIDYLPVNDTDPSTCFITRRDSNAAPMDRLRKDRAWMDPFYNYSSNVYEAQCSNLRGLTQTQQVICIEIVNMIENMDTLEKKLDQIITEEDSSGESEGDATSPTGPCWSLTLHQQYWNFNALHTLAVFIKIDLDDLQTKLTHTITA